MTWKPGTCTHCLHPHHAAVCRERFLDNADDWDTCACKQCQCGECAPAIRAAIERRAIKSSTNNL